MKRAAAFLLAGFLVIPTHAQTSSQPPPETVSRSQNDVLSDYDKMIAVVFRELFAPNVAARMVVEPAFEGEYAVGLAKTGDVGQGTYSIVGLFSRNSLWAYESLKASSGDGRKTILSKDGTTRVDADEFARLEAELPSDFRDVKVTRCEAAVPQELGQSIATIWREILSQPAEEGPHKGKGYEVTLNGATDTDTYFWAKGASEPIGRKLNPTLPSKIGFLAVMGDALLNYCERKDAYSLSMLDQLASGLEKDLHTDN